MLHVEAETHLAKQEAAACVQVRSNTAPVGSTGVSANYTSAKKEVITADLEATSLSPAMGWKSTSMFGIFMHHLNGDCHKKKFHQLDVHMHACDLIVQFRSSPRVATIVPRDSPDPNSP